MPEKSYSKKSYSDNTLEEASISLLEWDTLKTHLSSFAITEMGKRAILSFGIPSEYESSKRLLWEFFSSLQESWKNDSTFKFRN